MIFITPKFIDLAGTYLKIEQHFFLISTLFNDPNYTIEKFLDWDAFTFLDVVQIEIPGLIAHIYDTYMPLGGPPAQDDPTRVSELQATYTNTDITQFILNEYGHMMDFIIEAIAFSMSTLDIYDVLVNYFNNSLLRDMLINSGGTVYSVELLESYDYQAVMNIIFNNYTYNTLLTLLENNYYTELINRTAQAYPYLFAKVLVENEFDMETYYGYILSEFGQTFYDEMLQNMEPEPTGNMEESYALNDHSMYGSSRLGLNRRPLTLAFTEYEDAGFDGQGNFSYASIGDQFIALPDSQRMNRILTYKNYELSNHLGNVLVTVSDRRNPVESQSTSGEIAYYEADIASAQDYYPFGMLQPGRNLSTGEYRYGFNGKENINEIIGLGRWQDFGERMYRNELARFFTEDPISFEMPSLSPYQFANNSPIQNIDVDGLQYINAQTHRVFGIGEVSGTLAFHQYQQMQNLSYSNYNNSVLGDDKYQRNADMITGVGLTISALTFTILTSPKLGVVSSPYLANSILTLIRYSSKAKDAASLAVVNKPQFIQFTTGILAGVGGVDYPLFSGKITYELSKIPGTIIANEIENIPDIVKDLTKPLNINNELEAMPSDKTNYINTTPDQSINPNLQNHNFENIEKDFPFLSNDEN